MPSDLVLVQPSLRVPPTKLRKEIEGLEEKIEEEEDELKTLKNDYTILNADRSNPKSAEALVLTLQWINKTDDKITESKNRLSATKASLEKVEQEAELQNKGVLHLSNILHLAILTTMTRHMRLAQEGPDDAYVLDMNKFQLMKTWFDAEKVLLLRRPPAPVKRHSLFGLLCINDDISVAYYMKASRMLEPLNNGMSMENVWKKEIRLSLQDIRRKSQDRCI